MRAGRVLLFLIVSLIAAASAHACSCSVPRPVCATFSQHAMIFRGTVVESVQQPPERITVQNLDGTMTTLFRGPTASNVRFSVLEGFRGVDHAEVSLVDNGPCNYRFEVGKQYLVFADETNGTFQTSLCSGNRPVSDPDHDEDIQWMRALPTAPAGTRLFGRVILPDRQPVSGVAIDVAGTALASSTTDRDGRYSITGLPPGKYTVDAKSPVGFASNPVRSVSVEDRGCAQQDFLLDYDSHVRGRVTDANGAAVGGVVVQLQPRRNGGSSSRTATTMADGSYDLDRVWPGEYTLEVNKYPAPGTPYPARYYGGNAFSGETITVAASSSLTGIDVMLPKPWTIVKLPVKVVDASGKPVKGVFLDHRDESYRNRAQEGITTADDGTATLTLFADHTYRITAMQRGGAQTRCSPTASTTIQPDTPPLTLQLAAAPSECRMR